MANSQIPEQFLKPSTLLSLHRALIQRFVGSLFIAITTWLPEIVVSLAAVVGQLVMGGGSRRRLLGRAG